METKEKVEDKKVAEVPKKIDAKDSNVSVKEEKKVTPEKKPVVEKPKKSVALAEAHNLPISTKQSAAICNFIKKKRVGDAIRELEKVPTKKVAIPMKGEIPHRKGKIMAGRFPKNASMGFVRLLKNLAANADYNGLTEPVIVEAVANLGSRPYGRFGKVRRKRTHVRILAKDKILGGKK
ncbi:MAG: hypothetical protein KKC19_02050 [Nanoarchaeota archaeon]|nr:hypothetical protein [Nanoarchaeota archaeon]